jgi:hypothetical protein
LGGEGWSPGTLMTRNVSHQPLGPGWTTRSRRIPARPPQICRSHVEAQVSMISSIVRQLLSGALLKSLQHTTDHGWCEWYTLRSWKFLNRNPLLLVCLSLEVYINHPCSSLALGQYIIFLLHVTSARVIKMAYCRMYVSC